MKIRIAMLSNPQRLLDIFNIVYIGSGLLAVVATVLIVMFGNRVADLKERELKAFQTDADVRIAEAHRASDESNRKAADAMSVAAIANQKAKEFEAKAAELDRQAEILKQENIQLSKRQVGVEERQGAVEGGLKDIKRLRRNVQFSSEQVAFLKAFSGLEVQFVSLSGDFDAPGIIGDFSKVLTPNVKVVSGQVMGPHPDSCLSQYGIHIRYVHEGRAQQLAQSVAEIFESNHIVADLGPFLWEDKMMATSAPNIQNLAVIVWIGPTK